MGISPGICVAEGIPIVLCIHQSYPSHAMCKFLGFAIEVEGAELPECPTFFHKYVVRLEQSGSENGSYLWHVFGVSCRKHILTADCDKRIHRTQVV